MNKANPEIARMMPNKLSASTGVMNHLATHNDANGRRPESSATPGSKDDDEDSAHHIESSVGDEGHAAEDYE
jgi:hypothetical protein